ncbi:hypothetical protein SLS63_007694 [Diaporthe eres]|uniref:Uncharacterized protein n=1 Tax=Diaporthe eres TaxID=83184 RepID=A0ABR1P4F8_DIAER
MDPYGSQYGTQGGPIPAEFLGGQDDENQDDVGDGDEDGSEESGEELSDHSSYADQNDIYPPQFPLSPATYELHDIAEDEGDDSGPVVLTGSEDDRLRRLISLYPYTFLDPNGIWTRPDVRTAPLPIGQFRKEMFQKMAASGAGGQMQYVEFIPPWTDPDWSSRFIFTGQPGQDPVNDPQYQLYAKQGFLQSQRPALRDEDGLRDLTAAAKRYGVDPTMMDDAMYGKSGATPTQGSFNVQLGNPQVTPSNQGVRNVVDRDDYDALFTQYRNAVAAQGGMATEDDFKRVLNHVAAGNVNPTLGAACDAQIAGALLQYIDGLDKLVLRDEYQRILFSGSTSNEVRMFQLVETGVWTMDKTANSDLVTPLHDFFTKDKWEVTTNRATVPDQRFGVPLDSRKVYNFPGQQGEYCAANDYFWLAIQPALQLATMVLNSDHPATWAWADIYRMRPFHRDAGVERKDYFAVHLEEDPDEFYPEIARLKEMGFESIRWVCEILKECLVWQLNSKYTDNAGETLADEHQMAWTDITARREQHNRPFAIRISLSADYIWPLLIEEYSQAEKAACSFTLASTIVHELCHAIVYTRNQLFHVDRVWLRLNPTWEAQIGDEALNLLKIFGYRQVWDDTAFATDLVQRQSEGHDFFEGEDVCEEGWATENLPVYKAIPFAMFERFFRQSFWDQELQKWGPEALKIWPLDPPRAYGTWSVFKWRQIELRFGAPARRWMQAVSERVQYDDEHGLLWQWLNQLAYLAVEPKACMVRWRRQHYDWKLADKLLWTKRNDCKAKADQVVAYLQQLYNEVNWAQPIEPKYFREAFAAMSNMHRALSHEVATYQLITADYHKQTDFKTRADILTFYAPNLCRRLDAIHSQIAADCIQFLDVFESTHPAVLARISQNDQAVDLLDNARRVLREKFVAIQHAIRPVRLSFDQNPLAYAFNIQDFKYIKPISATDTAKRIEKTAKQQLRKLTGPLLTIAQGWISILERGERLRNPIAGTPDADLNARLTSASDFVNALKQRHQMEMAREHPPAADNVTRMLMNPNLLQPNQAAPDETMRVQRFNTASAPGQINPWQTVYAEASGFVPYRDPRTGLTRFHRANIPTEAGPSVNPTAAAQAQAQGQNLVAALAPGFAPGGDVQLPGGQFQADPDAAFRGLMQGLSQTAQAPGAPPDFQLQLGGQPLNGPNAVDAIRALVNERGRQVQADPAIAGHVVPSIYNRALQTVAGPNGSGLINSNVPGANNLFGMSAAQNSMANQQMEALIRQSALGPDPYATLGNIAAQQVGMQAPGAGVAPANLLYDPVGQPQYQPQVVPTPPQNPFPPGGGFQGPDVFPPPMAPPFPPAGGYQGPDVFPPPVAPPPQAFGGPQQFFPPQPQFPPQGGYQGQQEGVPPQERTHSPPPEIPPFLQEWAPAPPPEGSQGQ